MECGYCPLDLNKGRGAVLEARAAHNACDDHLRRFPGKAGFTLLGGEPLIHFPLLKGIVEQVRAEGAAGTPIKLITNGSLLTSERAEFLKANHVDVSVSVDGRAADNDARRVMIGSGGKSAFAAAWKGLELLGRERPKLNMVFCKDTAGGLADNVEYLRKKGFTRLTFNMDIFGEWPAESLGDLKAAMEDFVRYYRALKRTSPGALDIGHLAAFSRRTAYRTSESHGYRDIILGADGRYYACDGAFSSPYSKLGRWAIGDASSGIDLPLRQKLHDQAQKAVHGWLEERHYTCPRQVYTHALCAGRDPKLAVETFHRAENVVGEVLSPLAEEEGLGRE